MFPNKVSQYDAMVVVQAFFLTTIVVVGLTLYTFNTKRDLTFMGGTLYTLLMVSVIGGFLHVSLQTNLKFCQLFVLII